MIVFDHVSKFYTAGNHERKVGLDDVSVHIHPGDFVFLVGPSGAGKSTFIKLILRELEADRGEIFVDGKNVTEMSNREIPALRRSVGIVFQDFRLLPKKTVFENVAFAMEITHAGRRAIRRNVPQVLDLVGIGDKADNYPDQLSAGEKQRVAIARAVINNPKMLIADEPTGNLDPVTAKDIMVLLNQINRRGTTVVMVTHAKDIVDRMNKRVIAIEDGHVVRDDEAGRYAYRAAEEPARAEKRGEGAASAAVLSGSSGKTPSETSVASEDFPEERPVAAAAAEAAPEPAPVPAEPVREQPETAASAETVTTAAPAESAAAAEDAAPAEPAAAVETPGPAGSVDAVLAEDAAAAATAEPEGPETPADPAPETARADDVPFREEDLLEAIRESERRRAERYAKLAEKRVGIHTFLGLESETVRIDPETPDDGGKEVR